MLDRTVLKEHEIFLVSEPTGDVAATSYTGEGLYFRDTRFLSSYELTVEGTRPTLLSAAGEHHFMTNLQFANPPLVLADGTAVQARTISIRRNRFIHKGLHERIGFYNYNTFPVTLTVQLVFGADFRDMFDVRGYARLPQRGALLPPELGRDVIRLRYRGRDGVDRSTLIQIQPAPDVLAVLNARPYTLEPAEPATLAAADPRLEPPIVPPRALARFQLVIQPKHVRSITIKIEPRLESPDQEVEPEDEEDHSLDLAFTAIRDSYERWKAESTEIESNHEIFNSILRRASHDLRLLADRVESGFLPSAGIPWFSVPFGRDSLIASLQTLVLQPAVAYGTLRYLARMQGRQVDDWRDEEPGKILHEIRRGELAALREVPHTPYYGSVDSTPLFLVVLSELLRWTNDLDFARELRPHVEAALEWIDVYGDHDGDGYVEYKTRSVRGIRNQGWKDSHDSVTHRDGRPAEPPIALAEVQGYVYDARRRMAEYFRWLGEPERAAELERKAEALKAQFLRDFWVDEIQFFAHALDAEKRPVAQVTSNPGHVLWSGMLEGEWADAVARRLMQDDMLCGWGIRTLSSQEINFNPMSYHNGSVWPHDNSLIAAGLKRAGYDDAASRVAAEVIEAAMRFPEYRLPELYCGFARDRHYRSVPARYPVSCSPQAWAAGSVFSFVQTMLGLRVDAPAGRVYLRPRLIEGLRYLKVRRLQVAGHRLDFDVFQEGERSRVEVLSVGPLHVEVEEERAPQLVS